MSPYALTNQSDSAVDRLRTLQDFYDPITRARIEQTGVAEGWRCLEVGAGGGSIASWLSGVVGSEGTVLATDIDTSRLQPVLLNCANVSLLEHDIARDPTPGEAFDLIHARLVLLHLPERLTVLDRLAQALAPGGWLVVEDFDATWVPVLASRDPAQEELFELVHTAFLDTLTAAGADVRWGRALYRAVRDLGLEEVTATVTACAWPGAGAGIALHRANMRQSHDALLAGGLTTRQLTDFQALLDDPGFAVQSYPLVSASGRRPGATAGRGSS